MSDTVNKVCQKCKKEFQAKNYWQRFCSYQCRRAKWEEEHPRMSLSDIQRLQQKLEEDGR